MRCALHELPLVTFGIDEKGRARPTSWPPTWRRPQSAHGSGSSTGRGATADARPRRPRVPASRAASTSSNALAAAATALAAGLPFDAVVAGLQAPVNVPGRLERIDAGQPFTVLVDYAHTPAALESGARRGTRARRRAPGAGRLRLRRRPRHGEAAPDGPRRGPRRRPRRRHVRQPTLRGSGRDRRRRPRRAHRDRRGTRSWSSTGAPRSGSRSAPPRPGDVVVIAGQGPRDRPDDRGA